MATYNARPQSGQRAQKAWDVLAARYPAMRPAQLTSELKGALGWQWSMEYESPDGKTSFWDSVSVAEIRAMVIDANKAKRTSAARKLSVISKSAGSGQGAR